MSQRQKPNYMSEAQDVACRSRCAKTKKKYKFYTLYLHLFYSCDTIIIHIVSSFNSIRSFIINTSDRQQQTTDMSGGLNMQGDPGQNILLTEHLQSSPLNHVSFGLCSRQQNGCLRFSPEISSSICRTDVMLSIMTHVSQQSASILKLL